MAAPWIGVGVLFHEEHPAVRARQQRHRGGIGAWVSPVSDGPLRLRARRSRVDEVGNGVLGWTHNGKLCTGLSASAPIGSSVGRAPATRVRTRPSLGEGAPSIDARWERWQVQHRGADPVHITRQRQGLSLIVEAEISTNDGVARALEEGDDSRQGQRVGWLGAHAGLDEEYAHGLRLCPLGERMANPRPAQIRQ